MLFIGDTHGKNRQYRELIRDIPASIQLGDMGIGFRHTQGYRTGEFLENPPHYAMRQGNHRFIRGNHDNPAECRKHSQWIPDGHYENGMMFVGGGFSIDRMFRTEGYTWWPDEELSHAELNKLVDLYIERKPRIMVTHEPPREVLEAMVTTLLINKLSWVTKLDRGSRTSQALQSMWSAHSPDLWLYGHMHWDFDHVLLGGREKGTRFICLAELSAREVNLETLELSEVLKRPA